MKSERSGSLGAGGIRRILIPLCFAVSGCGLPQSGPSDAAVRRFLSAEHTGAIPVLITDSIPVSLKSSTLSSLPSWLLESNGLPKDYIIPGDTISITVFENTDTGVLSVRGEPSIVSEISVESNGMISLPYIGRIKASGNTIDGLRRIIWGRLAEQTPNPQILVRRLAGSSSTISVIGDGVPSNAVPYDESSRTAVRAISASGFSGKSRRSVVEVVRGRHCERITPSNRGIKHLDRNACLRPRYPCPWVVKKRQKLHRVRRRRRYFTMCDPSPKNAKVRMAVSREPTGRVLLAELGSTIEWP